MLVAATLAESTPIAPTLVPRLLVVDDEEAVLITIQGVLELDGYEVVATRSGPLALELLRSQAFDLLLTDLRVDDFDGLELLREYRQQSPDAQSIVLTGYGSLDTALRALREGAYDYLMTPCDVIELRTTVSRGLEHNRLAAKVRQRVKELEVANETIRALNLELEQRVEQATSELREQIAARDEFMATVSHDLKSPLTFIKGLSNLRRRRGVTTPETEPLLDALEQIEASAGRMAQQVIAEHQLTSDRHKVAFKAMQESIVGVWDEMRLGRVLDNLLGNAIKYSPRGGTVEVYVDLDVEADSGWAILRVSDYGEGIPEIDVPHIFEHFRRGNNVVGRIPGTGIGLSGVRRIIEQHGGSVAVDSHVGH